MRLLPLVLILAACAAPEATGPTRSQQALSRELADREAGETEMCIPVSLSSSSLAIVDGNTLTYRAGRTIWVNRLRDECPGLRPHQTLLIKPTDASRYCRYDRFQTLDPGASIPGPTCLLGDFTPYRAR